MHFGASAVGADGRRRAAGDAAAHLPGAATKQMPARRRAPAGWRPQQSVSVISLQTLTQARGLQLPTTKPAVNGVLLMTLGHAVGTGLSRKRLAQLGAHQLRRNESGGDDDEAIADHDQESRE